MIQRFGGWSQYRAAPARIVEEQIIAWTASLKAEADVYADKPS
jgi:hypothetical protein